jgi:hypothetical protein
MHACMAAWIHRIWIVSRSQSDPGFPQTPTRAIIVGAGCSSHASRMVQEEGRGPRLRTPAPPRGAVPVVRESEKAIGWMRARGRRRQRDTPRVRGVEEAT